MAGTDNWRTSGATTIRHDESCVLPRPTDAFCQQLPALADSDVDTTEAEDLAARQQVADAAPSEISNEMDLLVEAFERLRTFDSETASEEELADFPEFTEGLDGASTTVEEFAGENCPDLPPDFFSTG